jgi:chromosomal replication initiation ATPase DnaA
MSERPRQLAFDMPLKPQFGRDDFLVSPSNETAYGLMEAWPDWPDYVMRLVGPQGSGKSHLAAIWAERAQASTISAADIRLQQVPHLAAAYKAIVVEDCGRDILDEAALFHLMNMARERGIYLLLVMEAQPEALNLKTPDLLSRLRLAPSCLIDAPDEALLKAVLVKLFLDRQLIVDTSIVDFIANRIERSLAMAADIVATIDREALSRGRRVTRAIVAKIFAETGHPEDDEIGE